VYVQRVGFDPPPIEVAKLRLTGKLDDLAGQNRSRTATRRDSLPAIRAALRALGDPATGAADLRATLEQSGGELAGLAIADPVHLATVRRLRQLLDSLRAGRPCADCRSILERGLYEALPPAPPLPPRESSSHSPVGSAFRALLRSGPP
jgi:hypothetical protein